MNSIALDVVIGLVLIYLLFSVLLTTIIEYVFNNLGELRSKNLELSVATAFGAIGSKDASVKKMVDAFYNHGLIFALFEDQRKPSAIPNDLFSKAYLATLGGFKGTLDRPSTPAEFLSQLRDPARDIENKDRLLQTLEQLVIGHETSWEGFEKSVADWFVSIGDRSIGWYKRKLGWWTLGLSFLVAAAVNIDTLFVIRMLSIDSTSRNELVKVAEQTAKAESADKLKVEDLVTKLLEAKQSAEQKSDETLRQARMRQIDDLLANAYDKLGSTLQEHRSLGKALLDRCPKNTQKTQDTQQVEAGCTTDPYKWYEDIIKYRRTLWNSLSGSPDTSTQSAGQPKTATTCTECEKLTTTRFNLIKLSASIHLAYPDPLLKENKATWEVIQQIGQDIDKASELLRHIIDDDARTAATSKPSDKGENKAYALCEPIKQPAEKGKCNDLAGRARRGELGLPLGWDAELRELQSYYHRPTTWLDGIWWLSLTHLLGLFLSALALSLGAPFWFDLLGKVVGMRAAGIRREPGQNPTEASNASSKQSPASSDSSGSPPPADHWFSSRLNQVEMSLTERQVVQIQAALGITSPSGVFDRETRSKISEWRAKNFHETDPKWELDSVMVQTLLLRMPPPVLTTGSEAAPATSTELGSLTSPSPIPELQLGSRGSDVTQLKVLLAANNLLHESSPTDLFGDETDVSVRAFQNSKNLSCDGVVGPLTWLALSSDPKLLPAGFSSPPWMARAIQEIGIAEFPGQEKNNPRILEYLSPFSSASADEVPWCSAFVNWVLTHSGVGGTNSALASSWRTWGVDSNARYGAIIILIDRQKPDPGAGSGAHVAFLIRETVEKYTVLGGNQGEPGAVTVSNFLKTRYRGELRYPQENQLELDNSPPSPSGGSEFDPIRHDSLGEPRVAFGSTDRTAVARLQQLLSAAYRADNKLLNVTVDGVFGQETLKALLEYQNAKLLVPTGEADDPTWASLQGRKLPLPGPDPEATASGGWIGIARQFEVVDDAQKLLTRAEIELALGNVNAAKTKENIAAVMAVIKVETSGQGLLPLGDLVVPKILFEGHKLWEFLVKAGCPPEQLRDLAKDKPTILYQQYTRSNYLGGAGEWSRLFEAVEICKAAGQRSSLTFSQTDLGASKAEDIAYLSASWGLFQIMGFNWKTCGCESLGAFLDKVKSGNQGQLELFFGFLKATSNLQNLFARNWVAFAEKYNGAAYKTNRYDQKMAEAYASFVHQ